MNGGDHGRSARALGAWLAVALLAGCGAAVNRSYIESRFEAVHGCPPESVRSTAGGYVAEGCGVQAHFACFDNDHDEYEGNPDHNIGQHLLGAFLHGMISSATDVDGDDCIMEHSRRVTPKPRQASAPRVHVSARASAGEGEEVVTRMSLPFVTDGRGATVFALVQEREPVAALRLRFPEGTGIRDATPGCAARLMLDGHAEQIDAGQVRSGTHHFDVALTAEQLARVAAAAGGSVRLCQHGVVLDRWALSRIHHFQRSYASARSRLLGAPR